MYRGAPISLWIISIATAEPAGSESSRAGTRFSGLQQRDEDGEKTLEEKQGQKLLRKPLPNAHYHTIESIQVQKSFNVGMHHAKYCGHKKFP